MPIVDVNLNDVVEKPRLVAGVPYKFEIHSSSLEMSKQPNKHSGVREPVVKCVVRASDLDYNHQQVFVNWSLASTALSSDDPVFSIKKFFSIVGFTWRSDGSFDSDELVGIAFMGTVQYKDKFANLNTIDGPAA